jgi:oligo-1,6-glucosidase
MKGKWWQEAVIYQIYPRSFYDTNQDGIGDIQGIIAKLDYLKNLGINAIWVCPFYQSPMDDNGYDVSDFFKIAPEYGTLEDVQLLIEELHKRDMRLIVDLVLNHTSDEHPWFIESKKSEDNPYRDYYIWRKAREDGSLPSNWESFFGGSVWEYDETTDSYYMHIFSKKMPDLNWSNPKMRTELHDVMRWWLEQGVDGFRVDAVAHLERNWDFPNHEVPKGRDFSPCYHEYSNLPKVHDYVQEMNQAVLKDYDIMTVGEAGGARLEDTLKYCAYDRNEFNLLISFDHCWMDEDKESATYVPGKWTFKKLDLPVLKQTFKKYQVELYNKAWNTIYWSNHDQPRVLSHYGNDTEEYRELSAKMLATTLYLMGGTPIIYQGEEIGMTNVAYESLEDYRDVEIFTLYKETVGKGLASHEDIMDRIHKRCRDNARTPMQWDDTINGGFSKQTPWIKTNPNYEMINVQANLANEDSIYYYYQKLLSIRQSSETLIYGEFHLYLEDDPNIFLYTRSYQGDHYLVLTNFFDETVEVNLPEEVVSSEAICILTNRESQILKQKMTLRPYEALVYHL